MHARVLPGLPRTLAVLGQLQCLACGSIVLTQPLHLAADHAWAADKCNVSHAALRHTWYVMVKFKSHSGGASSPPPVSLQTTACTAAGTDHSIWAMAVSLSSWTEACPCLHTLHCHTAAQQQCPQLEPAAMPAVSTRPPPKLRVRLCFLAASPKLDQAQQVARLRLSQVLSKPAGGNTSMHVNKQATVWAPAPVLHSPPASRAPHAAAWARASASGCPHTRTGDGCKFMPHAGHTRGRSRGKG